MKALRVQVERVVRPIRASSLRKDRMREELLGHLTRLFDDEVARAGDAQIAAAEAIRRFGDANSLSSELQASVPWLERWAFSHITNSGPIRRRAGESPVRYIVRMNCWAGALSGALYALLALVIIIAGSPRPHRFDQPNSSQLLVFLMGLAPIQFAGMVGLGLLSEAIRQQLASRAVAATAVERRRATWRIVGFTVASSAVFGCSFAMLLLLIEYACVPLATRAQFWGIILGATAFGLPFTLLQSRDWNASMRRFENWESLDVDEPRPA